MAVLDTVAIASLGVYSELYGLNEEGNLANLYVSFGYLEDAPNAPVVVVLAAHRIPSMPIIPTMPTMRLFRL